ncbi:MAG: DUF4738 domain-containing protein [Prevotella sp.]|jgi:hypothetical protein|nr:DUF4738 domain-containing protein [Prevotella sp.]MCI1281745.1 DUF4738 domain-containing protein [Prevotella sp.]
MKRLLFILFIGSFLLSGCRNRKAESLAPKEDKAAKQMLQGIWVNEDEEDVAFRAKGDTIFYPDTTSQPVYFQILHDTLVLHGVNDVKYLIVKQAPHLFIFKNQNGEQVRLTKSEDPNDAYLFDISQRHRPQALNQNKLIKRDTLITRNADRYHCYVQINPTTYKVIKPSYNDDGVEVDNVYYDNIIHLSIYKGALRLFSHDFRKQDFSKQVPGDYLSQSILGDLIFAKCDSKGIHYSASLAIPDGPSSYVVDITISYSGAIKMQVL